MACQSKLRPELLHENKPYLNTSGLVNSTGRHWGGIMSLGQLMWARPSCHTDAGADTGGNCSFSERYSTFGSTAHVEAYLRGRDQFHLNSLSEMKRKQPSNTQYFMLFNRILCSDPFKKSIFMPPWVIWNDDNTIIILWLSWSLSKHRSDLRAQTGWHVAEISALTPHRTGRNLFWSNIMINNTLRIDVCWFQLLKKTPHRLDFY